jgi:DUF917 family protein
MRNRNPFSQYGFILNQTPTHRMSRRELLEESVELMRELVKRAGDRITAGEIVELRQHEQEVYRRGVEIGRLMNELEEKKAQVCQWSERAMVLREQLAYLVDNDLILEPDDDQAAIATLKEILHGTETT